jgi:tetratricopeptide (TPR) repeat protein
LQKSGRSQEAIAAWQKVIEINPNQSEALYDLWRAMSKTKPEEAKVYRARFEATQKNKQLVTQAETLANFALAAANRGDYAQAVSQLQQAIKECGDCVSKADLHKDLGLIECRSGNLKDGENNLLVAKALKPQDPDVLKALEIINRTRISPNGPH